MFIDSLCAWCHGACFWGCDVKGKKNPACHLAAEYRRPGVHCENIIEKYDIKLSAYDDTISYWNKKKKGIETNNAFLFLAQISHKQSYPDVQDTKTCPCVKSGIIKHSLSAH